MHMSIEVVDVIGEALPDGMESRRRAMHYIGVLAFTEAQEGTRKKLSESAPAPPTPPKGNSLARPDRKIV